ncbi:polyketide cyclase [Rhodococcus sp. 06-412-2C]|uniref:SRPBCC family protein n=1 Tax=unclassified Rhodococcus (in: high G+C Gram-positive bacteria) TaxID=192944 RepID=UPI000B9AE433|nr:MULTISPECIES: SRPBCC domain-containing protein [unclassified Rhodococcus (in: high G+C Gram-positive bacteria)]OZC89903.1 polyketide cyclase [Rhodococcus sp. 06-412-2C]OZC93366.1 polyketide cyclase [Rhodococcus sp. 06-412-2B]
MPFISSHKDAENLTMTLVAEFDAKVERVWQIWEDPRQLEKWWGPPTWPATFDSHDFVPGGRASYYMTGPDGEKAAGWWLFTDISAPTTLSFDDGFADDSRNPSSTMPVTHAVATLEDVDGRTRMTIRSRFDSLEQLEQLVEMSMDEGMALALGQIDAIVAD